MHPGCAVEGSPSKNCGAIGRATISVRSIGERRPGCARRTCESTRKNAIVPFYWWVDQRTTMFFGSARTTKATAAAEGAALAAWRAVERGDRVGAIIFDDEEFRRDRTAAQPGQCVAHLPTNWYESMGDCLPLANLPDLRH